MHFSSTNGELSLSFNIFMTRVTAERCLSTHVGGSDVRKFWLAFNFCRKKQSPVQSGRDSKQLLHKTRTRCVNVNVNITFI